MYYFRSGQQRLICVKIKYICGEQKTCEVVNNVMYYYYSLTIASIPEMLRCIIGTELVAGKYSCVVIEIKLSKRRGTLW